MRSALAYLAVWLLTGCSGLPWLHGDSDARPAPSKTSKGHAEEATAGNGTGGSGPVMRPPTAKPVRPSMPPPKPEMHSDMDADAGVPCEVGKFCSGGDQGCGTLRLETDVQVTRKGNLLVIFDQSISMRGAWQMTTKIEAAKAALVAAISPLQDVLTVGAVFLPTATCRPRTPMGGAVAPIESPSQVNFVPGNEFLQAWEQHWVDLGNTVGNGTPLNEAFDRADLALQAAASNMTVSGRVGVVVFTDGEPNCTADPAVTGAPTLPEPQRAAQWLTQGIQTYVVGLPGAQGVAVLDDIAESGGTTTYITPDDPAQLAMKMKEVVEEQVTKSFASCSITLDPAADLPDKLQLVVEENGKRQNVPHQLSVDAGWTISADGAHVELLGSLCEDAKAGRFDAVTFEYGCEELPPLAPD